MVNACFPTVLYHLVHRCLQCLSSKKAHGFRRGNGKSKIGNPGARQLLRGTCFLQNLQWRPTPLLDSFIAKIKICETDINYPKQKLAGTLLRREGRQEGSSMVKYSVFGEDVMVDLARRIYYAL